MASGGGIGSWIRGLFRGNPPPPMAPPPRPPEPVVRDEDTPHLERWNGKPGQMRSATVVRDVRIQGVPCKAGELVTFHGNGRLQTATLAIDWTRDGESLGAGARILLEHDGRLGSWNQPLTSDREFLVLAASGERVPVVIPAESNVCWESGQLREVVLAGPVSLDGMAFPTATRLLFGDSGALSHVTCREEIELRGIRWARGRTVVFEFGHLREGYPAGDGTYDGIPYQEHEIVRLHDNGRMARCYLSCDTTLSGVPCAANTRIYLDDEGNLLEATLAEDCTLAGVPLTAEAGIGLKSGKPALMKPREDCEVDGIPCARDKTLELTTSGRIVRATLSRAHAVGGWLLPAGTTIVLDEGKLLELVASDAVTPDGRDLPGMWRVFFDDTGAIRRELPVSSDWLHGISVREPTAIDGYIAAPGATIDLEDNRLASLVLASDQRVGAVIAKAGTRVHFHDNGSPSHLQLAEDTQISGVPCAAARTQHSVMNRVEYSYREDVRLHPDGTLRYATLAAATTLAGVPLAKGDLVSLHENGTPASVTLAARWTHSSGCTARKGTWLRLTADGAIEHITLDEPFTLDGTTHAAGTVLTLTAGVLTSSEPATVPLGPCEPLS